MQTGWWTQRARGAQLNFPCLGVRRPELVERFPADFAADAVCRAIVACIAFCGRFAIRRRQH
jgi:hypothetical protein